MSGLRKILFIDRDGTLIVEPPDDKIDSLEKLEFIPYAISELNAIVQGNQFELVMVTNQDGLGTPTFPNETFVPAHNKMLKVFENEGIVFSKIFIDCSFPEEKLPTRKPGTAMLTEYFSKDVDLKNSFVIGDRVTDIQLAQNLGARAIFITGSRHSLPSDWLGACAFVSDSWKGIAQFLTKGNRHSEVNRKTNETEIKIDLNLDGSGKSKIETGLAFFDHMLDQLARHGGFDIAVQVKGDLHVDEHHTIEDTALALGEAFTKALGDKRGIMRYGFLLPMDDCLAQVAIDFGGRPWLVWEADFKREKIGEMPTEMFMHFFKSFSDTAKCNLNIKADGTNEHHKIESIFKAFAKAVKMAVKVEGNELPTTKGIL
jgi:imidazoleglycerol-phosphate dehydratase / histidinol-phosphatase